MKENVGTNSSKKDVKDARSFAALACLRQYVKLCEVGEERI